MVSTVSNWEAVVFSDEKSDVITQFGAWEGPCVESATWRQDVPNASVSVTETWRSGWSLEMLLGWKRALTVLM